MLPKIHEALLLTKTVRNGYPIELPSGQEFSEKIDRVFVICQDVPEGLVFLSFCCFLSVIGFGNNFISLSRNHTVFSNYLLTFAGECFTICDTSLTLANVHLYKLLNRDAQALEAQSGDHNSDQNGAASLLWELPCCEFDGIWENLIFDDSIKDEVNLGLFEFIFHHFGVYF